MIAISFFLFVILVATWLVMPGGESKVTLEPEASLLPETQTA
jgi:hypothetical protein